MTYTNIAGLPQPIVDAITNDPYDSKADISVTGLISPPKIRQLTKRHEADIMQDISDRIYSLLGTSVHYILDQHGSNGTDPEVFTERRLFVEHNGVRVSGSMDHHDHGVISDYKVTSTWAVIDGVKPEWEQQLNLYAHLCRANSLPVEGLQIVAILRDWQRSQAAKSSDYPPVPVAVLPVPLWDADKAAAYFSERIELHMAAEVELPDNIPHCTPEERWARPTTWAVVKPGGKRAVRVLDTKEEAAEWGAGGEYEIQERPGADTRCDSYCAVNQWCSYYKAKGGEE